jgi:multiple sugar transport system permease protein
LSVVARPRRASRRLDPLAWPYLLGLTLLVGVPLLAALYFAFTEFTGVRPPEFNGLANFERLIGDDAFWRALGNSAIFVLIAVPLRMGAAIAFALLLYRRAPGVGAARAVAYLPTVVPDAVYALLWLWILNPLYGPLPLFLESIGVGSPSWLTDPWGARFAVALMGAFQIGEAFVIALAARRSVPDQLYDAARIEGASGWFTLSRVTLPFMAPVLALLTLRDVVLTLQVNFVPALLLTDGGPRYATTFLPLYVYRTAFRYFRLGYASTIALTMFVLTAAIIYVQYRLARRWRLL